MDLSIILPTYNEKDNIGILIEKLNNVVPPKFKKEIIIVDDNSNDGTYLFCKEKYSENKEVRVILRDSPRSLGKSIGDGIKNSNGDLIIVMDTDLSHNPNHIPEMLNLIKSADIISCSRYCQGGNMENKLHFIASYLYNVFLKIILNTGVSDNTGGYFCIKKNVLQILPQNKIFYGYGDFFFRLLFFSKKNHAIIKEIPTKYKTRTYGTSKSKFLHMAVTYFISALRLKLNIY